MEEKICPVCKSTIPLQFVSMESWNQWKRCPSCYKKANIKEGECFFFLQTIFISTRVILRDNFLSKPNITEGFRNIDLGILRKT